MALLVEDGTGVVGANSYVDYATARAFATARGVTLSAVDSELEVLLVKAMDYLEAQRALYQGDKVSATQSLQWPRSDVIVDGYDVAANTIPVELKNAQCQLAIEFVTVDPMSTSSEQAISMEKVDTIEVRYAVSPNSRPLRPIMPKVEAFLKPLYRNVQPLQLVRI